MNTREELTGKSVDELREIAAKLKIKVHHKAGAESIIGQIVAQPVAYQRDAMEHVATTPLAPTFDNSEEEVLSAVQSYIDKGLVVKFPGDSTWHFSFKGREECGNMQIPLRIIKNKAENVSRGALRVKMMNFDGDHILAG